MPSGLVRLLADAIDFAGTNIVMRAPPGREETVNDVRAFRNAMCCVTCWQLSDAELAEIARTRRVYLSVFMGGGRPPVYAGGEDEVRAITVDYGGTFPKQAVAGP